MACAANIAAIGRNHFGHAVGCRDKAADIVEKCAEDDVLIVAILLALLRQVSALQRMFKLRNPLA